MTADLTALLARARRAYEWSRLRRAAVAVTPIAVLVGVAALLATRPGLAVAVGGALLAAGVASLWFGHDFDRGLAPGVLAGLVPLAAVNCAVRIGHACTGTSCRSLCLTACALGGVAAGLLIGAWAVRRTATAAMWGAAGTAALLTGTMGCSCAGLTGVAALGLGLLAAAPLLAVDVIRRRRGGA